MAEKTNFQGSEIEEVISRSEDFVTRYKWHLLGGIAAIVLISRRSPSILVSASTFTSA